MAAATVPLPLDPVRLAMSLIGLQAADVLTLTSLAIASLMNLLNLLDPPHG